jgi:hypothetical protein
VREAAADDENHPAAAGMATKAQQRRLSRYVKQLPQSETHATDFLDANLAADSGRNTNGKCDMV